jgi:UDP-N-acetylmuramyl pentapeptide phosphotransferase/UDP-N-acetylglucosamine-1-phosphate transferase
MDLIHFFHTFLDAVKYVYPFAIGLIVTWLLVPLVIRLAPRLGMIDIPDARRVHTTPTPRGGGMALWIGFHVALGSTLFLLGAKAFTLNMDWWVAMLLSTSILFVVGVLDDSRGMSALVKLAGQAVAAITMTLLSGHSFSALLGIDLPEALGFVLTVVWYLAFINAFNLIDGLDGLCSGLAMIGAIGLGASYIVTRDTLDLMAPLALIGCCLGFLRYNFHPAKIFLGDTGSMFLGFALASFALATAGKSTVVVTLGIAVLSAGIPLFDTALAVWRRSMRKMLGNSGSVMGADKDHLHHRLLASGLSTRKVAVTLYIASATLVALGLMTMLAKGGALGMYLLTLMGIVYVVVRHIAHIELWDTGSAVIRGLVRPKGRSMSMLFYLGWDLMAMAVSLAIAFILIPVPIIEASIGTREEWLRSLPYWIAPVFGCLFVAKIYRRVWSKASSKDFFYLQVALLGGVMIAFALQVLIMGGWDRTMLARTVIFGGSLYLLVIAARSLTQVIRVVMSQALLAREEQAPHSSRRLLLYGLSERCVLYLRYLEQMDAPIAERGHVIGIIDDDLDLRRRVLKHVEILGTLNAVSEVLEHQPIDEIVVTCDLTPGRKQQLEKLAEAHNIKVSLWDFTYTTLSETRPKLLTPDEPVPASGAEPASRVQA